MSAGRELTWTCGRLDAIRTKRMVRRFRGAAARARAPRADRRRRTPRRELKNQQRWDFIAVEDRDRLRALSAVGPHAGHVAGAAAAVALLTPDPRRPARRCRSSGTWDSPRRT